MEQLQLLWEYQELDLLMDQRESERKNSKLRHRLIKLRNRLINLQDKLVKMDEEADKRHQALDTLQSEYENMVKAITMGREKLESDNALDEASLEDLEKEAIQLKEKIDIKEKELNKLIKDMNNLRKKVEVAGQNILDAKKEYAKTKAEYDKKIKEYKVEFKKLEEKRNNIAAKIEKALLARYNSLKPNNIPVVSLIDEDRCAGCNMSLASLVVHNVKDKKMIMECENCGRLLISLD